MLKLKLIVSCDEHSEARARSYNVRRSAYGDKCQLRTTHNEKSHHPGTTWKKHRNGFQEGKNGIGGFRVEGSATQRGM